MGERRGREVEWGGGDTSLGVMLYPSLLDDVIGRRGEDHG